MRTSFAMVNAFKDKTPRVGGQSKRIKSQGLFSNSSNLFFKIVSDAISFAKLFSTPHKIVDEGTIERFSTNVFSIAFSSFRSSVNTSKSPLPLSLKPYHKEEEA